MKPSDLSRKMRGQRDQQKLDDGFKRETFTLPVDEARTKAREILDRFPVGGYSTVVERVRISCRHERLRRAAREVEIER